MAEFISAKDLPITEVEEVDVLCVDNGELKRKQAKGLGGAGGYVIKVPVTDVVTGDSGMSVNISESYDNFAQILYDGGNVVLDFSALAQVLGSYPSGTVMYVPFAYWTYIPGMGIGGGIMFNGNETTFTATNGSWTPPAV